MVRNNVTPADLVIILASSVITVFFSIGIYGNNVFPSQFVIEGKNGIWVYPVNQKELINIAGPLGNTVIDFSDGRAQVLSSPCSNQSCVASGVIHRKGQWIACLPNGVFVRVEARGEKKADHAEVDGAVW
jgi:hypothetical protein